MDALTTNGEAQADDRDTRWEGYSDYQIVSRSVASTIEGAVEAYARIQSAHTEGAKVNPSMAAEARGRILAAAMKLVAEMQRDRGEVELYDDILDRWTSNGDPGYIEQFQDTSLIQGCPDFLFQFVLDIRQAGWELGYLQAGRTVKGEPEDPIEAEAKAMFRE